MKLNGTLLFTLIFSLIPISVSSAPSYSSSGIDVSANVGNLLHISNNNGNRNKPNYKQSANSVTSSNTNSNANSGGLDVQLMLQLVNTERTKVGVTPLVLNAQLCEAAQSHSEDQANCKTMTHTGSNGSSPSDRCKVAGYNSNSIGENVAWNQKDVQSVMQAWINSPGHYANIVNKDYKDFGCGMQQLYWTQNFGGGELSNVNSNGGY